MIENINDLCRFVANSFPISNPVSFFWFEKDKTPESITDNLGVWV